MENENTNVATEETKVEAEASAEKTYTQEEVLKLLQSETDKRVSQALKTQQKKHEKELSLSKLDGSEREKAEQANRIAELEEMISQMNTERNKSELKSVLSSRGLSAEFADILSIGDDIEAAQANIDKLDKLFKEAVKAEVTKRLAGNTPKGNGTSASSELTKEKYLALPMAEQNRLYETKREFVEKLLND